MNYVGVNHTMIDYPQDHTLKWPTPTNILQSCYNTILVLTHFYDILKKFHVYHLHGFAIGFDQLGLIFRSKSIRMLPCLNGWIHAIDRYLVLLHADNEFTFCEEV